MELLLLVMFLGKWTLIRPINEARNNPPYGGYIHRLRSSLKKRCPNLPVALVMNVMESRRVELSSAFLLPQWLPTPVQKITRVLQCRVVCIVALVNRGLMVLLELIKYRQLLRVVLTLVPCVVEIFLPV